MAQTWTVLYSAVTFAAAKNMGGIRNAHASELIKIRRVGLGNSQTAAVVGVVCLLNLNVYHAGSPNITGGTAVVPVSHDSTNTLPASAIYVHNGTIAGTAQTMKRVFWSSDEPAISTAGNDELETFVPLNIVWDAGYYTTEVQPLTLRQNQQYLTLNSTGAVGLLDSWIEFTKE
jgi:hypothetical protein